MVHNVANCSFRSLETCVIYTQDCTCTHIVHMHANNNTIEYSSAYIIMLYVHIHNLTVLYVCSLVGSVCVCDCVERVLTAACPRTIATLVCTAEKGMFSFQMSDSQILGELVIITVVFVQVAKQDSWVAIAHEGHWVCRDWGAHPATATASGWTIQLYSW